MITMRAGYFIFSLILTLSFREMALANGRPNIVLRQAAYKETIVTDETGKTRTNWTEITHIQPGELIKFALTYTNIGSSDAKDAVIVNPVPQQTTYVANSAKGKDTEITFSLDGKSFKPAEMLKYRLQMPGKEAAEYLAKPEMYTHIRWKFSRPVAPGSSGEVSFLARTK